MQQSSTHHHSLGGAHQRYPPNAHLNQLNRSNGSPAAQQAGQFGGAGYAMTGLESPTSTQNGQSQLQHALTQQPQLISALQAGGPNVLSNLINSQQSSANGFFANAAVNGGYNNVTGAGKG